MQSLYWINLGLFVLLTAASLFLFGRIVHARYRYVLLGKKVEWEWNFADSWGYIFGQKKLLKDKKSGWMHVIMFYGFILIQFGAIDLFIKGLFPGHHLPIPFYPAFQWLEEVTVLLVFLATGYAYYRRYVEKLSRLKRGFRSGLVIIFLTSLLFSIIWSAAFEKVWLEESLTWTTPLSSAIAFFFVSWMSPAVGAVFFYIGWWMHALILFSFLLYVPQSKHFHLLVAPLNIFLRRKRAQLSLIDFEDESAETFGAGKIEDFAQKQLIDLYACVECGRCTSVCPASGTGKMLSPMDLIVKMRNHLTAKGAAITSSTPWMPSFAFATEAAATNQSTEQSLIGDVITPQELWACTTCRNCEDACPVMNEHVDKIIDMRRYLVLTEGSIRPEASRTLNNIERQGNPWGLSKKERANWIEESKVPVPTVKENPTFDYLFFVGSMGSYDLRTKRVTEAFVKLLTHAGISFAILGNQEKNSGDTPRRLGNEFLFQQQAEANIAKFNKHGVKKIITMDPHAFNLFKHEYRDLGWDGEVIHHTQLLAQLVKDKKIVPSKTINERITYHDSCYLGRYNDEYEAPRYILRQIPGVELVEMTRNRENAMCCGAGGGMMWLEETEGKRVNLARTEQALEVSPTVISSACPYCLTMLSDGTKAKEVEDQVQTYDIAELLAQSVELEEHIS
ncbi:heterodisulfide reductase-related iron-sulfur binding cluster [Shimazuella kribbensis]|uniref:heterodisulfide reductase-related iron-sulfur binding cluster n=1 Tax=Shimazuella kribbensis TaxID=139808 RepID=UPI000404BEC8|nr:heterodisulfide reductase-related iron-sulfur binding cluster [Shimazuella kribbensis]